MARPAADRGLVRARVLDAADDLLARGGYRNMTIDALAAAAGLSKGAVYLHFASKEEIAIARIDRVIEQLLVVLDRLARASCPAPQRLRDMLITRVLFRLERVRSYTDSMQDIVSAIRPRLLEARRNHHRREAIVFEHVVRDGIRRLELRACAARRVSEALIVATNALLPADLRPDEMDLVRIRARVECIADLLIGGLALPGDRR
jgi:AcrR family transcriptional regulator